MIFRVDDVSFVISPSTSLDKVRRFSQTIFLLSFAVSTEVSHVLELVPETCG